MTTSNATRRPRDHVSIAAIILAAGESRRLGRPKQLLRFKGETLLARTVRMACAAELDPVFVILGANADLIGAGLAGQRAHVVHNADWSGGISTSIRAGLHALETAVDRPHSAMILSCDQPHLTTDHLRSLVAAYTAQCEPALAASFYAGVRGIPAVFPQAAFPELFKLQGDQGARRLLQSPLYPVVEVPFELGAIDIDTDDDLPHLS